MSRFIDFYFDFISPYSYFAHKKIKKLEKKKNIKFIYKPILLGGLHNSAGITAPAFINLKKEYIIDDCKLLSRKLSIKFKFNPFFPINSLKLMRGLLSLTSDKKDIYIDSFYDAYWQHGLDLNNCDVVHKILEKCNINISIFRKKVNNLDIKLKLRRLTDNAFKKKIFGAPTFVVNKKIFWGQDRFNYALEEFFKKN